MKQERSANVPEKTGAARAESILGNAHAHAKVPKKWEWHHRALTTLKNQLIKESGDLRREITHPAESPVEDIAEFSVDEFEQGQALHELAAETDALNEVNDALGRIFNGTYGICEQSGKPIPAGRLKAVPWTRYTREVKEQLEKQG
jgi:RNA polymerase-binding transcription factor DksA